MATSVLRFGDTVRQPPPTGETRLTPADLDLTTRVVSVLVLCGLAPLLLTTFLGEQPPPAFTVQYLVVVHAGAGLAVVLSAREIRVMQLGFWLFSYVWMGLAPLAMIGTNEYPWALEIDPATALTAALITELGLAAYTLSWLVAERTGRSQPTGSLGRLLGRHFGLTRVVGLTAVGLVLTLYVVPRTGGLQAAFSSRQAAAAALVDLESGFDNANFRLLLWVMQVSAMWGLLGLLRLRRSGQLPFTRNVIWLLLTAAVAMNIVVNNPISQPRFWAGTVIGAVLFSSFLFRRVWAFRLAAWALVVLSVVLFPYSDFLRTGAADLAVVPVVKQFTSNADYDAFQQLATGLLFVEERGHSPWYSLGLLLAWVPRSMWPAKPEAVGADLAQFAGYRYTNLSSPLWAETYVWGGLAVTLLVFAALGWLGCRLDQLNWALRDDGLAIAGCLVPALGVFQLFLLRGSLVSAAIPLMLLVVLPLLVSVPTRRDDRSTMTVRQNYQTVGGNAAT